MIIQTKAVQNEYFETFVEEVHILHFLWDECFLALTAFLAHLVENVLRNLNLMDFFSIILAIGAETALPLYWQKTQVPDFKEHFSQKFEIFFN